MKPHIWRSGARWVCFGLNVQCMGNSPMRAYQNWRTNAAIRSYRQLVGDGP
jgi:hypothetical protein